MFISGSIEFMYIYYIYIVSRLIRKVVLPYNHKSVSTKNCPIHILNTGRLHESCFSPKCISQTGHSTNGALAEVWIGPSSPSSWRALFRAPSESSRVLGCASRPLQLQLPTTVSTSNVPQMKRVVQIRTAACTSKKRMNDHEGIEHRLSDPRDYWGYDTCIIYFPVFGGGLSMILVVCGLEVKKLRVV